MGGVPREEQLKAQLKAISSLTDQSLYGKNAQPSEPPIVLLRGPPGTEKTQGMEVVAVQTKKNLYILSHNGLRLRLGAQAAAEAEAEADEGDEIDEADEAEDEADASSTITCALWGHCALGVALKDVVSE